MEKDGAGFRGPIKLTGFRNYGSLDLTKFLWTYQVQYGYFDKIQDKFTEESFVLLDL